MTVCGRVDLRSHSALRASYLCVYSFPSVNCEERAYVELTFVLQCVVHVLVFRLRYEYSIIHRIGVSIIDTSIRAMIEQ